MTRRVSGLVASVICILSLFTGCAQPVASPQAPRPTASPLPPTPTIILLPPLSGTHPSELPDLGDSLPTVGSVNVDGLNVRAGPGTEFDILRTLTRGDQVGIIQVEGEWYKVRLPPREGLPDTGWVHSAYITPGAASVPAEAEGSIPTPTRVIRRPVRPTATLPPVTATPTPRPPLEGRLVFQVAVGEDIYVINADGTGLTHLTVGLDPSWSPDGSEVLFARWQEQPGIYAIRADGQNERQIFGVPSPRSPVWSPDGSRIAFTFKTGDRVVTTVVPGSLGTPHPFSTLLTFWGLGLLRLDDYSWSDLVGDQQVFSPTWSPDGKTIAFDGERGICVTDEKAEQQRCLTDSRWHASPAWSPDGSRIAFMSKQHDQWDIWTMSPDGTNLTALTKRPPFAEKVVYSVSPAWSPDGKYIAFLSDRDGQWDIYVMNADGSDQRKMFETALENLVITYDFVNERVLSWTE